jgi:VIT1/CCC1 family predicted Fe2+/Mn2+ transporter
MKIALAIVSSLLFCAVLFIVGIYTGYIHIESCEKRCVKTCVSAVSK